MSKKGSDHSGEHGDTAGRAQGAIGNILEVDRDLLEALASPPQRGVVYPCGLPWYHHD